MVAHFDVAEGVVGDCAQLTFRLNRILPRDIAISKIEPVDGDMHARFSATARTYHYYIHTEKDPFLRRYSWEVHYKLDFVRMTEAAHYLLGEKDFKCFCKAGVGIEDDHLQCYRRSFRAGERLAVCLLYHRQPLPSQYGACRCGDTD